MSDVEQRIAEIRQTLRAARLKEIAEPLEGLLDYIASVPSQVEAAVKAERENCLNAALDVLDSKTMRYEYCVNAGDAVTAAIRSRGEAPSTPNQSEQ
jgi:hypothetical protein